MRYPDTNTTVGHSAIGQYRPIAIGYTVSKQLGNNHVTIIMKLTSKTQNKLTYLMSVNKTITKQVKYYKQLLRPVANPGIYLRGHFGTSIDAENAGQKN